MAANFPYWNQYDKGDGGTDGDAVSNYSRTRGLAFPRFVALEDDIAVLFAFGYSYRIAPIPGKGTIGIEVPNSNPKIVSGQSIIGSKKFQESTYDLPVALGKTITNEVLHCMKKKHIVK